MFVLVTSNINLRLIWSHCIHGWAVQLLWLTLTSMLPRIYAPVTGSSFSMLSFHITFLLPFYLLKILC